MGSTHGWHKREGRRFVGDGDDCNIQGKRQAEEVLTSHMDVLHIKGWRGMKGRGWMLHVIICKHL